MSCLENNTEDSQKNTNHDCGCSKKFNCECVKCVNSCPEEEMCKCGCDDFIYVYNTSVETIVAGGAATFNNPSIPLISTNGLQYTASQNFITVTETGVYKFEYVVFDITATTTFALFLNGVEIQGSRYEVFAGSYAIGQGIFKVTCDDLPGMIQLINVGTVDTTLVAPALPNTVDLSLLINRIN